MLNEMMAQRQAYIVEQRESLVEFERRETQYRSEIDDLKDKCASYKSQMEIARTELSNNKVSRVFHTLFLCVFSCSEYF